MGHETIIVRRRDDVLTPDTAKRVAELLRSVRYGSITIVVQEGKIAQIDKTEKFRMTGNGR